MHNAEMEAFSLRFAAQKGMVFNMPSKDALVIGDLAKKYMEHCRSDRNSKLKDIWIKHNNKERTQPLILYGGADMYNTMYITGSDDLVINDIIDEKLICETPLARSIEKTLRWKHYLISIEDDTVFDPYLLYKAVREPSDNNRWGIPCSLGEKASATGASCFAPSIHDESDLEKLYTSPHKIDYDATEKLGVQYQELLGDALPAYPDTRAALLRWTGDISTDFAKLIGLEQLYNDFYDRPEFLHKLLAKMRDAILQNNHEWEASGDCRTSANFNQAIPYSDAVKLPENYEACRREDLWAFFSAQEFTSTSTAMFEEFCLNYQLPIMEKFGLIAYGCCENMTNKITSLRRIKNLRRISVTPFSNAENCIEQIGTDYLISYRPNPATMVAFGVDEDLIRKELSVPLAALKSNNSCYDINLKDVHTVSGSKTALIDWVLLMRKILS